MSILAEVTSEIIEWSKDLMPWQRLILKRLLANENLSESDRSEIFKRAKIDHGFEKSDRIPPDIELEVGPELPSERSGLPIRLTAIKGLQGANALRSGQEMKFGEQLTVVYGENGSGKSGYARVLKKACSAKAVEEILPNVYSESDPEPASCMFHCDRDGTAETISWKDGEPTTEDLKRFAVFDSNCARVYVSSENQLQIAPAIFEVFEGLAGETDAIKQRFIQFSETLAPNPDTLAPLIDQTSIGDMLAELSHTSDPDEILQKAHWGKKDDEVLTDKQADLVKLRSQSPEQAKRELAAEKKRLELIRDHLKSVEDGISESRFNEIRAKVEEHRAYDQAATASAQLASGTSKLAGIGEPAWRELLLAASRYSDRAYPSEMFPYTGSDARCVLCQQPLETEAKQRLESFWAFLNSEASTKRATAKRELDRFVAALNGLPHSAPPELLAIEDALLPQHRSLLAGAKHYFENATKRSVAMTSAVNVGSFDQLPPLPISLLAGCTAAIDKVTQEIASLEKSDIGIRINAVENDVKELSARKRLRQNLSLVTNHLEALKQSFKASSIADGIWTNSISLKAGSLQTKYLTETYTQDVQNNIKALGVRSARTRLSGRSNRGKVLHRLRLDSSTSPVSPELVLSEGERTGVSLAFFFAELGAGAETPGIILDDPVTSLDHRIREKVVKRLIEEAKHRQVIIFTHDLVFYSQLLAEAKVEQVGILAQHIESFFSSVGLISDSQLWDALPVDERIPILQGFIDQAKEAVEKVEPEEYRSKAFIFYDHLRATWEVAVEELLFNKVVARYDKGIKTLRLTGVAVDTEGITSVYKGMTLASAITPAHSHAAAENQSTPTIDDMKDALTGLKTFIETQRKKRKIAVKERAHLQP
jgi:energy-coupling factor transporter ATP-binding protein EcfA2